MLKSFSDIAINIRKIKSAVKFLRVSLSLLIKNYSPGCFSSHVIVCWICIDKLKPNGKGRLSANWRDLHANIYAKLSLSAPSPAKGPHRNPFFNRPNSYGQAFSCIALFLGLLIAGCGQNKPNPADNQQAATNTTGQSKTSAKNILFFGDSLTARYGLDDPSEAFPGDVQTKIDSAKLQYTVINAGVSGETTAGGKSRIDWILKQNVDVFVLELGANDGLRGIPITETTANLQAIVDKVKAKYPQAKLVLLGMMVPPNMGNDYASKFKAIFPQIASKNNMALVPFLLQGVAGIPLLNQADGIHPTAQGAKIVAGNVWQVLKPVLQPGK
jgi:acyl-CoA thioesterase-1